MDRDDQDPAPDALRRLLEPDERLLWHARPRAYGAILEAGLALIGRIVVPIAVLLLAWTLVGPPDRSAVDRVGWRIALPPGELRLLMLMLAGALAINLLAGVLGALSRLGATLSRSVGTHYGVTDRRLILAERGRVTSLRRVALLRLQRCPLGDDIHLGQGMALRGLIDGDAVKRRLLPFLATRDDVQRPAAAYGLIASG